MSQENVQVVRHVYNAFNRGEFASAVEYLHPSGEVYPGVVGLDPPGSGSATRLHGRVELRQFFEDLGATWESISVELREVIDAPDGRVLAVESWLIRGRDGIEVDTSIIRVLRQPHGFESLGSVEIAVDTRDEAVPERVQVTCPAASAAQGRTRTRPCARVAGGRLSASRPSLRRGPSSASRARAVLID